MARTLSSGMRCIRALAQRRNSLIALRLTSLPSSQEVQSASNFLCPHPSLPVFSRPRFISDLSSANVTEEESQDLDSDGEKNGSGDDTPGDESKSSSSETEDLGRTDLETAVKKKKKKKPLHQFFSESVGLTPKTDEIDECDVEEPEDQKPSKGVEEMKKSLRELEEKVKGKVMEPKLASLFGSSGSLKTDKRKQKRVKVRAPQTSELINSKELSPLLVSFVERLIEEGYMKKANFLKDGKLDSSLLCTHYARNFVRSAAAQFGADHQEVAKSISRSELKKVALIGCPQVEKNTTFSAKCLRSFFEIQESTVCEGCKLNQLCSFKNMPVPKKESLPLGDALRVLTSYAVMSVHPELQVAEETMRSVSNLLEEVLELTS